MNSHPAADVCQTSLQILEAKCAEWIQRNFPGEKIWMPDQTESAPPSKGGEILHVILAGGFLRRFLESGNWNLERVKLWTLGHRSKRVLTQVMGVPHTRVGVIPRNELFSQAEAHAPSADGETWIFAGRLSPTKNLEMLIHTVWYLQTEHGRNIRLELIGDFDDQANPDEGVYPRPKYKAAIAGLIAGLDWKVPPTIRPKTSSRAWLEGDYENPRFVSFSTFISEDFGVSLAQAQSAGWPALVTDWGGHADATGEHLTKIPWVYVARAFEPESLIRLKARQLAARLGHPLNPAPTEVPRDVQPLETNLSELDGFRRNFLETLGPDAARLYRGGPAAFASTPAGRAFFARYRLAFAGSLDSEKPWCILLDDPHSDASANSESHCQSLLERAIEHGRPAAFVKLKDLKGRDAQWTILNSHRVILPFYCESAMALAEKLPTPYEIAVIP